MSRKRKVSYANVESVKLMNQDIGWGDHREWHWEGQICHWRHLGDANKPSLLLIHGFATGSSHWRGNAAEFADKGWSVFGLDLIGFGDSSQPGSLKLDNRLWARQVNGFIEEVIRSKAVLVGHSLGGLVALSCCVFFPTVVKAVIASPLPDPTLIMRWKLNSPDNKRDRKPPWKRKTKRWMIKLFVNILPLRLLITFLTLSPFLEIAAQMAYKESVIGDRDLRRIIRIPARRKGAIDSLRSMTIAMALRPNKATAKSLLERVSQPMLLIWGEDDRLVPLDVGWECQRYRRDLVVKVIQKAGHCPHDEQPHTFNKIVVEWLSELRIRET